MSKKKPVYKIWWFWVIVALAILFCVGLVRTQQKEEKPQDKPEPQKEATSLQKCVAMEAADLYNTGATAKVDEAFEKAKTTCKDWQQDWGSEQFEEVVEMDWKERQTEQIDDKQLTEYLDKAK